MALTNGQYDSIMRIYEETQTNNELELQNRKTNLYQRLPRLKALEEEYTSLRVEQVNASLSEDATLVEALKKEQLANRKEKALLLAQNGISEKDLEISYQCPDCKDSGYIGQEKCHCFKQRIISILYKQSNISEQIEQFSFDHLSREYYDETGRSLFDRSLENSKKFVENFDSNYQNLLFYGTVGTGKSYMSGCIAKALLERGYSVIYFSAISLFETLAKYTFDRSSEKDLEGIAEDLYTCDLLIIDDLGTELINAFTLSQFFALLNERILRRKPIIISSNLTTEELRDHYSDRIFSRVVSNFTFCKLIGPDIRNQTKGKKHIS